MTRNRVRMWLLIGFAPLAVAGLVVVVKILSMYAFAHQAITAHVQGDPGRTVVAALGQEPLNWFEPYKAPYNQGVGLAGMERLPEARAQFERALPLAHGLEVCAVQLNLALVIERQGDAADDPARAQEFYAEALALNVSLPEECRSPEADAQSPDPERENAQTQDEQQDRLQQKQQDPPPQDGDSGEDEPDQPSEQEQQEQQDKLDEIEEKLESGAEEREQGDDGEGSGSGTDKPW
ncbi:tetratricopeptide repeat protein [Microbacterium sp. Marseille-Q6965]|uniref:tetratricopeptide repeat protein n=1 Tax=Microbacterium sp. Marseille-Q6965 TaxID=2965072 RepID=UPI0021B7FA2A|nr:tetratricopeptide repeat protein [Microbacterium sp. Marseille-Q6965]